MENVTLVMELVLTAMDPALPIVLNASHLMFLLTVFAMFLVMLIMDSSMKTLNTVCLVERTARLAMVKITITV
jgi:hypothetical protein